MFLPERGPLPVDGINLLRNEDLFFVQSLGVYLCKITAQTKLAVDVRSELQMESLARLIVLQTQAGLVEGPGLGDVPGVVRVGPGRVEEETVGSSGKDEHGPGTGGDGEDPGQNRAEDGGGEDEETQDGVDGPHTSSGGRGGQVENEETGQNAEAGKGEENLEENVEELVLVQDVVLVSVEEVEVDQQSDGQGVAGEDCQVEQREGEQSFLHRLHLLRSLPLLGLILLLPADVLHHEDCGDGGEDPAGEPVEPPGNVDLAANEDGVQAQHREYQDSCVTVA